uniref:Uncharacterized protein n=1 Tax=Arundo donax TaxID=35708 RepID=A0A0A9BVC0_ARUDO
MLLTSESVLKGDGDDALEELGPSLAAVWELGLSRLLATFLSFAMKSFGRQPFNFSSPVNDIIR